MSAQNTGTNAGKGKLSVYFRGVKAELKKVIWPSKKELTNYTAVVLAVSGIIALTVYLLDLGIHWILGLFI